MKEKTWRKPLIEKMDGGPVSRTGMAKPAVTPSDVYRDANDMLGMLFKMIAEFFGGPKAGAKIKVGSGGKRSRVRNRKAARKGWF